MGQRARCACGAQRRAPPPAFWGGRGKSFETAARLAPTLPPRAAPFPRPPSLRHASQSSHSSWGQDRGHPPSRVILPRASPCQNHRCWLTAASSPHPGVVPPAPPRSLCTPELGKGGSGRRRPCVPERREVCRKPGLRRLVWAVSSASPRTSPSESLSLFPLGGVSVSSFPPGDDSASVAAVSCVSLSPLAPVGPGNTGTKTGFELLENYPDNNGQEDSPLDGTLPADRPSGAGSRQPSAPPFPCPLERLVYGGGFREEE